MVTDGPFKSLGEIRTRLIVFSLPHSPALGWTLSVCVYLKGNSNTFSAVTTAFPVSSHSKIFTRKAHNVFFGRFPIQNPTRKFIHYHVCNVSRVKRTHVKVPLSCYFKKFLILFYNRFRKTLQFSRTSFLSD